VAAAPVPGNPTANLAPVPDFPTICVDSGPTSPTCQAATLAAIQRAHMQEGIRPMVLPSGFWSLPPASQLFVATNLERVERGLRPMAGLTSGLDSVAGAGAQANTDPRLSGSSSDGDAVLVWASVWGAYVNPLAMDYVWMYEDGAGPGDANIDCPSAGAAGCWGHRDNILYNYGNAALLLAGAAGLAGHGPNGYESDAEIFVGATGPVPTLVYAWSAAVAAGAR
jgi:hypothetical protein